MSDRIGNGVATQRERILADRALVASWPPPLNLAVQWASILVTHRRTPSRLPYAVVLPEKR